jgi:DNA-binding CsgD family transcriptional regulator/catechol 2,3-dioxygenase-like lactoylglutathione lyase family enzyme
MPIRGARGRPRHDDVLTPAEWRVVHAIQHGMSTREIAARRGISIDAVKFHLANVYAKLGIANRKALRQWFRAPKGSALQRRQKEKAMTTALTLGSIGQVSRTVRDIAEAERWYGSVLGLPHLYTFGKLAFFDCAGTRLYLQQTDGAPPAESCLYLRVDDIRDAHATLQARGVEFVSPPHLIHRHPDGTEEWMAFFKDPEGRPLAIMSQVRPTPDA